MVFTICDRCNRELKKRRRLRAARAARILTSILAEAFTICQQKPKFPVGNSNGTAHFTCFPVPTEMTGKIHLPFVNSHSTRFTSATFPAFRHCRCNRHFDLLLFSSSRERLGPGETPHRENPVPLPAFHSNRIFRANDKRPGPLHNDDVKSPNLRFCRQRKHATENPSFSVFTLKPLVPIYF